MGWRRTVPDVGGAQPGAPAPAVLEVRALPPRRPGGDRDAADRRPGGGVLAGIADKQVGVPRKQLLATLDIGRDVDTQEPERPGGPASDEPAEGGTPRPDAVAGRHPRVLHEAAPDHPAGVANPVRVAVPGGEQEPRVLDAAAGKHEDGRADAVCRALEAADDDLRDAVRAVARHQFGRCRVEVDERSARPTPGRPGTAVPNRMGRLKWTSTGSTRSASSGHSASRRAWAASSAMRAAGVIPQRSRAPSRYGSSVPSGNGQPPPGTHGRSSIAGESSGVQTPPHDWVDPPSIRTRVSWSGVVGQAAVSPRARDWTAGSNVRPPLSSRIDPAHSVVSASRSAREMPAGPPPTMQTSAAMSEPSGMERPSMITVPDRRSRRVLHASR